MWRFTPSQPLRDRQTDKVTYERDRQTGRQRHRQRQTDRKTAGDRERETQTICEPVWLSGKALGWQAETPRFDFASALLSLPNLDSVLL